ncbi:hypothetical protein [Arcobacter sp.]|uniref:hypothetical protein n=1 Tax=Arcobacter sp. TaxID=1872629 RepID=UPI003D1153F7
MQSQIIDKNLIQQIGNDAVREAQKRSLENGIPNVYSKNNVLYYQLPDGTITMEDPFSKGKLKQQLEILTKVEELSLNDN